MSNKCKFYNSQSARNSINKSISQPVCRNIHDLSFSTCTLSPSPLGHKQQWVNVLVIVENTQIGSDDQEEKWYLRHHLVEMERSERVGRLGWWTALQIWGMFRESSINECPRVCFYGPLQLKPLRAFPLVSISLLMSPACVNICRWSFLGFSCSEKQPKTKTGI